MKKPQVSRANTRRGQPRSIKISQGLTPSHLYCQVYIELTILNDNCGLDDKQVKQALTERGITPSPSWVVQMIETMRIHYAIFLSTTQPRFVDAYTASHLGIAMPPVDTVFRQPKGFSKNPAKNSSRAPIQPSRRNPQDKFIADLSYEEDFAEQDPEYFNMCADAARLDRILRVIQVPLPVPTQLAIDWHYPPEMPPKRKRKNKDPQFGEPSRERPSKCLCPSESSRTISVKANSPFDFSVPLVSLHVPDKDYSFFRKLRREKWLANGLLLDGMFYSIWPWITLDMLQASSYNKIKGLLRLALHPDKTDDPESLFKFHQSNAALAFFDLVDPGDWPRYFEACQSIHDACCNVSNKTHLPPDVKAIVKPCLDTLDKLISKKIMFSIMQ